MFFKSKKETAQKAETAPVIEKKELLYRENIRTGCAPATKQEAIMAAGKMLVETGYVEPEYAEAMLEREKTCSTFMGNGLALPHGVEAAKKNLVKVSLVKGTIPHEVEARFGGSHVFMRPAAAGTGLVAGGAMRAVLDSVGVKDVLAKSKGSSNPHNLVKATIEALTQVRDAYTIAGVRGISMEKVFNG